MTKAETEVFVGAAVAMICCLLEDNAPIAARCLPADPVDTVRVLAEIKQAGIEIAVLAQSAISALSMQTA